MKKFNISTNVYFGSHALDRLGEISGKRVLMVCDKFMLKSGTVDKVAAHLGDCEVHVFSDIVPDPPIEVVAHGIRFLTACKAEVMIAVGGGSVIDAAKAIREMASQMDYIQIEECYAIPTTSGTGSEVTKFSVITNAEEGVKYPLVSEKLEPMVAILDPELVVSAPPSITADTGMDALTHALEAYVSINASDFSDALAEKAITLLCKFLPMAYADGNDLLAREKVHNASCLAGMAFNTAGLGITHSIAHSIGGRFHLPHGRTNAIILPYVMQFNANLGTKEPTVTANKYQRIAKLVGLPFYNTTIAVNNLIRLIKDMERSFGIPANFKQAGLDPEKVKEARDDIAKAALADACTPTNPRPVNTEDLKELLSKITPIF